MPRPAQHVDVARDAVLNIEQPTSGIQTTGFPNHSKFAAAWANWLFRYLGEWERELDEACLRAEHLFDPNTPILASGGNGFALPVGAGLADLTPSSGGTYYLEGRYVDLSDVATKYAGAFTLAPTTVYYAHARPDPAGAGSSTGEVIITTNATEVGYTPIATFESDATDVISSVSLTTAVRVIPGELQLDGSVTMQGAVSITGPSQLDIAAPTNFSGRILGTLTSATDFVDLTQAGAGMVLDLLKSGAGTAVRIQKTGSAGTALQVSGLANSTAIEAISGGGTNGVAVEATGGAGVGLSATSTDNYPIIATGDSTSPQFGQLKLGGADDDPTQVADGAISYHSGMHQIRFGRSGQSFRSVAHAGPGSYLYAVAQNVGATFTAGAVASNTITAIAEDILGNGYYGLAAGARVLVTVTCGVRASAGAAVTLNLELIETTNGNAAIETRSTAGTMATSGFFIPVATTGWQQTLAWQTMFVPANEGDLGVGLRISSTAGNILLRDLVITLQGTF